MQAPTASRPPTWVCVIGESLLLRPDPARPDPFQLALVFLWQLLYKAALPSDKTICRCHVASLSSGDSIPASVNVGQPYNPNILLVNLTVSSAFIRTMTSHNALDSPDHYGVAWIAALPIERAAAKAMLDEEHAPPTGFVRHQTDANVYTWGRVGEHNIVIASLAAGVYGTTSAATTASSLLASLPSIRVGLLVGIGGGIARPDEDYDIRLGDVVVSQPDGTTGGVCQYDLIKAKSGDRRERKGFLRPPPTVLLNALASIQADHESTDSKVPNFLQQMLKKNPKMNRRSKQSPGYIHQGTDNDRLFQPSCDHVPGPDCRGCNTADEVKRDARDTTDPQIHYGTIASGNSLVKDAATRDRIVADVGVDCICFEMEAAGLMNHFPCLVIRGICDYADSHKNDRWQRYASATAAAYAKELLAYVPVAEVHETKRALEVLDQVSDPIFSHGGLGKRIIKAQ